MLPENSRPLLREDAFTVGKKKEIKKTYTCPVSEATASIILHRPPQVHFYFYKSDHGNLIGRQKLVAKTAHYSSRRCWRYAASPASILRSRNQPLFLPSSHPRASFSVTAEVSFLN